MANYTTHLAFNIAATRADAERFIKLIEASVAIEQGLDHLLAPEIEPLFKSADQSAETILAAILGGMALGIDRRFDAAQNILGFNDIDGNPNLEAFAICLQRLFPLKLPLGFVYADDCDKHRPSGFGGGLFAIGADAIVHRTRDELLDTELNALRAVSRGR